MVVIFECHPGHEITDGRFGTLVQVYIVQFETIMASASSGVIDGLIKRIFSQKPIEGIFHQRVISLLRKYLMEQTQRQNRIGYVDGLLPALKFPP